MVEKGEVVSSNKVFEGERRLRKEQTEKQSQFLFHRPFSFRLCATHLFLSFFLSRTAAKVSSSYKGYKFRPIRLYTETGGYHLFSASLVPGFSLVFNKLAEVMRSVALHRVHCSDSAGPSTVL